MISQYITNTEKEGRTSRLDAERFFPFLFLIYEYEE